MDSLVAPRLPISGRLPTLLGGLVFISIPPLGMLPAPPSSSVKTPIGTLCSACAGWLIQASLEPCSAECPASVGASRRWCQTTPRSGYLLYHSTSLANLHPHPAFPSLLPVTLPVTAKAVVSPRRRHAPTCRLSQATPPCSFRGLSSSTMPYYNL